MNQIAEMAKKLRRAADLLDAIAGGEVDAPEEAVSRRGLTDDGRKKLAAAMRKQWAAKRAAGATKKTTRREATRRG